MNEITLLFLMFALLLFALGYHYTDLAFNAKCGAVDVGNNLDSVGLHMWGIKMLFMSALLFCIALISQMRSKNV